MSFSYPPPVITAELSFDALLEQRKAAFITEWQAWKAAHPDQQLSDYSTGMLESTPEMIALRAGAGGDMFFVARSNDVARATVLVDFATGTDLDLHGRDTRVPAHPEGVERLDGELDTDYAARIIEARAGSSAAGPDEWWLTNARAADNRIRSIGLAYRGLGQLDVYLLSKVNGGVPDQAMLDAVTARLIRADVKPRNVVPTVHSAIIQEVDVTAGVWLVPEAPESRLTEMAATAKAKHNAEQALDVDLTHHYLKRLLDGPEVYKITITAPNADLVADPSRAYSIRSITLSLAGRAR